MGQMDGWKREEGSDVRDLTRIGPEALRIDDYYLLLLIIIIIDAYY